MSKHTYFATFCTNNGSTYGTYEYSSKREAIKSIREICRGNTFAGNIGNVLVTDLFGDTVYQSKVR